MPGKLVCFGMYCYDNQPQEAITIHTQELTMDRDRQAGSVSPPIKGTFFNIRGH